MLFLPLILFSCQELKLNMPKINKMSITGSHKHQTIHLGSLISLHEEASSMRESVSHTQNLCRKGQQTCKLNSKSKNKGIIKTTSLIPIKSIYFCCRTLKSKKKNTSCSCESWSLSSIHRRWSPVFIFINNQQGILWALYNLSKGLSPVS